MYHIVAGTDFTKCTKIWISEFLQFTFSQSVISKRVLVSLTAKSWVTFLQKVLQSPLFVPGLKRHAGTVRLSIKMIDPTLNLVPPSRLFICLSAYSSFNFLIGLRIAVKGTLTAMLLLELRRMAGKFEVAPAWNICSSWVKKILWFSIFVNWSLLVKNAKITNHTIKNN